MSSATSKLAQKLGRTKFFLAVTARNNNNNGDEITWNTAITFDPSVVIPDSVIARSALITLAEDNLVDGTTLTVNRLYKDLGREIVVYDDAIPGSLHRDVYRECLYMNGAESEGADGTRANASIFVKVFSAYGSRVDVARTG
jgi:hypothetical protein